MPSSEHDHLFRETFQHPQHALGLLRSAIPTAIAEHIDWSTLALESGSFVDEVSSKYADLLFSVRIRDSDDPLLVQILTEHQSTPQPLMALRMAGYVVRALERYATNHGTGRLPAVLPLVVAQCEQPWSAALDLRELYGLTQGAQEAIGPHLLDVRYLVDDLVGQTEEQIRQRVLTVDAAVTLLALRSVRFSADFVEAFQRWADLLKQLEPEGLSPVLVYALRVGEGSTAALRDVLRSTVSPEAGELVMTTAERLIESGRVEGVREGIQEGIREERRHLLVTLLEDKFPSEAIPANLQKRIAEAPADTLMLWFRRALKASSLQDAFAEAEND